MCVREAVLEKGPLPSGYTPLAQCTAGGRGSRVLHSLTESGGQGPALRCSARRRPTWGLCTQPHLSFTSILPTSGSGPPDRGFCCPSAGADAGEHCGARPEAADPAAPAGGPGPGPHGRVAQHAQLVLRPPAPLLPTPCLLQKEPAQTGEAGAPTSSAQPCPDPPLPL